MRATKVRQGISYYTIAHLLWCVPTADIAWSLGRMLMLLYGIAHYEYRLLIYRADVAMPYVLHLVDWRHALNFLALGVLVRRWYS